MPSMPSNTRGVECHSGWQELYQPLIDLCSLYGYTVQQVKEKFGGMCFYYSVPEGTPDKIFDLVIAAEHHSRFVCEDCGTSGVEKYIAPTSEEERKVNLLITPMGMKPVYKVTTGPSRSSGWIRSLCAECREKWDVKREQEMKDFQARQEKKTS